MNKYIELLNTLELHDKAFGLTKLWKHFFYTKPMSIKKFLSYKGIGELSNKIYKENKKELIRFYNDEVIKNTWYNDGELGTGKTIPAILGMLYEIYLILNMKENVRDYIFDNLKVITCVVNNKYTYDGITQLLKQIPLFEENGTDSSFKYNIVDSMITFKGIVNIRVINDTMGLIGLNVASAIIDRNANKNYKEMEQEISGRIFSRGIDAYFNRVYCIDFTNDKDNVFRTTRERKTKNDK